MGIKAIVKHLFAQGSKIIISGIGKGRYDDMGINMMIGKIC